MIAPGAAVGEIGDARMVGWREVRMPAPGGGPATLLVVIPWLLAQRDQIMVAGPGQFVQPLPFSRSRDRESGRGDREPHGERVEMAQELVEHRSVAVDLDGSVRHQVVERRGAQAERDQPGLR